jgi:hypothetical protein
VPEALARFDDDEDYAPRPQRQRAPQRRKAAAAPAKEKSSLFAAIRRRPGRAVLAGCAALTMVGIVANATLMQNARHPSPLFGASTPLTPPPAPVAVAPTPSPRPADLAAAAQPAPTPAPASIRTQPASTNALTNLIRATSAPAREQAPEASGPRKDQIAALLKGDSSAQDRTARVAAAQRALQKVGFVVKPDGSFGATTRQAIERFERDRGLTVTGDLSPRTLRELSAQSGVAIP